jgi:hypothetical protein
MESFGQLLSLLQCGESTLSGCLKKLHVNTCCGPSLLPGAADSVSLWWWEEIVILLFQISLNVSPARFFVQSPACKCSHDSPKRTPVTLIIRGASSCPLPTMPQELAFDMICSRHKIAYARFIRLHCRLESNSTLRLAMPMS